MSPTAIGEATLHNGRIHVRVRVEQAGAGLLGDYVDSLAPDEFRAAGWVTDRELVHEGDTAAVLDSSAK